MGLDIYLYTNVDNEASNLHYRVWDEVWNEFHDEVTGKLKPGRSEEEYKAKQALTPPTADHVEPKSLQYPDHLFNRRYLRSSYNGSGFNRAVPEMLGRGEGGLYWIFEPLIGDIPEPDDADLTDEHINALENSKERALSVAKELRQIDPLRVITTTMPMVGIFGHAWSTFPDSDQALAWYRNEMTRDTYSDSYTNAKGEVFGKGLEVLAVVPAPRNGAHLIYRLKDDVKETYIRSAEIVAEFCDEAMMLIKRDGSCHMSWSG